MRQTIERSLGGLAVLVMRARAAALLGLQGRAQLLTQVLMLGIIADEPRFLSAYGGMVSLAQIAIYGIAGFVARQRDDDRTRRASTLGLEPVDRRSSRRS